METPTVEDIKKLAYSQMDKLNITIIEHDPISTLTNIVWPESKSRYTQLEVRQANFELNPTFCFGRAAVCLAVMEKYFSQYKTELAEVLEDGLAKLLLDQMPTNPETSYLEEILMYEDPHSIVIIAGAQFDPIIVQHNLGIKHPRVNILPGWETILTEYYLSLYNNTDKLAEKIFYHAKAEKLCPKIVNIKENKIELMVSLGKSDAEIIALMKTILEIRPTARLLYSLHHFTGDEQYLNRLTNKYTNNIVPILNREVFNG